mmetsp:Transcript_2034/g.2556  ORF Transcript_2034/g.2556 Transcript_2034/m.2556 type:complete len:203 (+) Transcript_2034:53-661(+)|eukprot:CAMPEP_0172509624 /NCGR_PEP_ID=MMETSP1066-20121228/221773_1 /TAXON_ID=671091 /ORGANISM="Coscinodiscus wailesii, Strain CCMP2513" /LENGTH=202 /DNA_ID=CAMNT_0013288205 /DNA_START=36 /DNA_END=644 /DNA_ORIENTATION=+
MNGFDMSPIDTKSPSSVSAFHCDKGMDLQCAVHKTALCTSDLCKSLCKQKETVRCRILEKQLVVLKSELAKAKTEVDRTRLLAKQATDSNCRSEHELNEEKTLLHDASDRVEKLLALRKQLKHYLSKLKSEANGFSFHVEKTAYDNQGMRMELDGEEEVHKPYGNIRDWFSTRRLSLNLEQEIDTVTSKANVSSRCGRRGSL